jgi:hypothetical protein
MYSIPVVYQYTSIHCDISYTIIGSLYKVVYNIPVSAYTSIRLYEYPPHLYCYAECCYTVCHYAVSLCWLSLCWVLLCWVLLYCVSYAVSLCWLSLCWMSLCWMSWCLTDSSNVALRHTTQILIVRCFVKTTSALMQTVLTLWCIQVSHFYLIPPSIEWSITSATDLAKF